MGGARAGLPHMVPTAASFSAALDALGIAPSDTVVVYDGLGIFSAPRVWWTFKVFGHERCRLLLVGWASGAVPARPSCDAILRVAGPDGSTDT